MRVEDLHKAFLAADPEERRRAVASIRELAPEQRPGALLRGLSDADWRVRKEATQMAAGLAPAPDVLAALLSVLGPGDDVGQRNAAVEALGGFGAAAIDAIAASVEGLDADGRKLAAEALALAGGAQALSVLAGLTRDPDPNVRAAAVESVSVAGAADLDRAAPLLLGCLTVAERFEALTALEGLNRLGVPVPWELLRSRVDDPVLERAALVAIGRGRHVEAAPRLVRALGRGKTSVRVVAVAALAAFVEVEGPARQVARVALTSLDEDARRWLVGLVGDEMARTEDRKNALLVLGAIGTTHAAEVAIGALADDRIAEEAETALTMLGPAAVLALAARARLGAPQERVACVQLLGRLADETTRATARQAILDAAQDAADDVVRAALVALSTLGDERSMGLAARWLSPAASPQVRHAAAAALASCAARYPDSARALARHARPDAADAAIAAVVMGATEGPALESEQADVEFLAVAASNEDPLVRRLAIDALGRMRTASAVSAVSFALSDEAPEVQLAAARALGRMRDEEGRAVGVRHLLEVVTESADDALSVAAMEALGDAGDADALEVLQEVLRRGPPMRAVIAAEAIGRLRAPGRLDALIEALAHPDTEVLKVALRATFAEADPRVEEYLGALLAHGTWDVRRLAADLLGQRGDEMAKTMLRQQLAVEEEPLVLEAIQRSLADVEGVVSIRRSVPPPSFGGADE
jgi:HEAT repeat protein